MVENPVIGLNTLSSELKPLTFRERVASLVKPALYHPRRLLEGLTLTESISFATFLTFGVTGLVRQACVVAKPLIPDIANMIIDIEPFSHYTSVFGTAGLMIFSVSTGVGISNALKDNGHKTLASLAFHASSVTGALLATSYQWAAELSGLPIVLGVQDEKDFIYGMASIIPAYLLLRNARNQPKS